MLGPSDRALGHGDTELAQARCSDRNEQGGDRLDPPRQIGDPRLDEVTRRQAGVAHGTTAASPTRAIVLEAGLERCARQRASMAAEHSRGSLRALRPSRSRAAALLGDLHFWIPLGVFAAGVLLLSWME